MSVPTPSIRIGIFGSEDCSAPPVRNRGIWPIGYPGIVTAAGAVLSWRYRYRGRPLPSQLLGRHVSRRTDDAAGNRVVVDDAGDAAAGVLELRLVEQRHVAARVAGRGHSRFLSIFPSEAICGFEPR